jgi:protease I
MTNDLNRARIAFLVANEGIEQVELTELWKAVVSAGGEPTLVAPKSGKAIWTRPMSFTLTERPSR